MLGLLALFIGCGVCVAIDNYVGPINIKEGGQNVTRYVLSTYPPNIHIEGGSTIVLQHNTGVQIAQTAAHNYSAGVFMEYKLWGKTLSYTADLSTIDCSCNAAFYLVSMPGYGSNGQPNPGKDGSYYCDANYYVTQVTPHECSQPPGGYITNCDRGGCGTNGYNVDPKGMGPDSSFKINTQAPFRNSVTFGSNSFHVKLSQGSNTFEFDSCDNAQYVQNMAQALNYGMTIVMSHWGDTYSTMQWLDGKTGCRGDCNGKGFVRFGDIEIR